MKGPIGRISDKVQCPHSGPAAEGQDILSQCAQKRAAITGRAETSHPLTAWPLPAGAWCRRSAP